MIVGLCGKIRSGKTEIAKYLSEKYNVPVYRFAEPLKKLVTEMCGLTDDDKGSQKLFTGRVINIKPVRKELFRFKYEQLTPNEIDHFRAIEYYTEGEIYRLLLQYVGTNIFRTRNYLHWVQRFNMEHRKEESFIVDDIRFRNEYNLIESYDNSDIYKVVRDANEISDMHKSETELDTIEFSKKYIIKNNTDNVVALYSELDKIFKLR